MMHKKLFPLIAAVAIALVSTTAAFAQGQAKPIESEQKEQILKGIQEHFERRAFVAGVDFGVWPSLIEKRKDAIEAAETDVAFAGVINSAFRDFGFSHISLRWPAAVEARNTRRAVGIGIRPAPEDDGVRILFVFKDSPAEKAGLQAGDLIVMVDGTPAKDTTNIAGEPDTPVQITIQRGEVRKTIEVIRGEFSTDIPETINWVDEKTAMIVIPTFDRGYSRSNIEGLFKEAMKADNLILDLRNNGGGAVINMHHLLSLMMPVGSHYGAFITRATAENYVKETNGDITDVAAIARWMPERRQLRTSKPAVGPFEGNIVVLINGASGSASEISAISLQETRGATVIGSKSAGAVLASIFAALPVDGWQLQIPIQEYVSPKGKRLEGVGVEPDHAADNAKPLGEDPGVIRAVEHFKSAAANGR
jgi:carboxyl-terminal processing protease